MKARTVHVCQSCGAQQPRWVGRCPECGEFGTIVEERTGPAAAAPGPVQITALGEHDPTGAERVPTGVDEVDRVLGGGLVRGSVVLLAGEPGIGKSTLVLQAASSREDVLLVCGEEAPQQVRARAERLGGVTGGIRAIADPALPSVLAAVDDVGPSLLVVDSIQTIFDPDIASAPGSVSQVRECGARLARLARERGTTVVLVGHVTKEGVVAGPRVLEHLVDVVLHFEGDRTGGVRVLRALKNRFGSTAEVGFFEMTSEGLLAIRDASRYLLADRCPGLPGSVLAAAVDGQRPFVLEVQALVAPTRMTVPRRTALGVDASRLPLLLAVLERRLGVGFGTRDVFVSAVGGIRIVEPAADLPVVLALLSSESGIPLPDDVVAFGEVGLAGEVRRVQGAERRLAEARSVGCRGAIVPPGVAPVDGVELIAVRRLQEVAAALEQLQAARAS